MAARLRRNQKERKKWRDRQNEIHAAGKKQPVPSESDRWYAIKTFLLRNLPKNNPHLHTKSPIIRSNGV